MHTLREVLSRAAEARGVPFAELAKSHGLDWSDYPASRKSLPGLITRAVLGIVDDPGFEVRAIPVTTDLKVQERTKVCSLSPNDARTQSWASSQVSKKLRSILFVPIVKPDKALPGDWYLEIPFVWNPSAAIEKQLAADYEEVRALVRGNQPQKISTKEPPTGQGKYLIANTSGRNAQDLVNWGGPE